MATRSRRRRFDPVARARRTILDPVRFARIGLRAQTWDLQDRMLAAVAADRRVAVKGCNASSKTFSAALAVLWWVVRYMLEGGIAITTAPTYRQVKNQVWSEIHRAAQRSKFRLPPMQQTRLELGEENYAFGFSARDATRFQGFHGRRVLVVVDEAAVLEPRIEEGIEGIAAGGQVHQLWLGNPTIPSGPFYDAFKKPGFRTLSISAFQTPNLLGLDPQTLLRWLKAGDERLDEFAVDFPVVSRRWVADKLDRWGLENPMTQGRVFAEFPSEHPDQVIPLTLVERMERPPIKEPDPEKERLEVGVDVAGPGEDGDETVVAGRRGSKLLWLEARSGVDAVGYTIDVLNRRAPGERALVKYDCIGVGAHLGQPLREAGHDAVAVNVSDPPQPLPGEPPEDAPRRFASLNEQIWEQLRRRAEAGTARGLADEEARAQLAGRRWRVGRKGRLRLESKQEIRNRGAESPDRADGVVLAYAELPPGYGRAGSGFAFA